jgi:very-short-patch-repair endonuclease
MHALAARQHGCVTTAQLVAAGVDRRQITRGLADGMLRRIHRGVYLVGPVASPLARYAAALLGVRAGVLSHRAAAALYDLVPPPDDAIDITTTARGPRSREGIRVHTTATLLQSEVRLHRHVRLTSPERTLLDLAASGDDELERALEEAQVRRLVSRTTLAAAIERHKTRRGAGVLADMLEGAHDPSLTRSEAERRLLALVRAANLPPPRTNVRVGPYEVDFLWPSQRLIVEVDGFAFHSTRAAFERDRVRDAELQARGYRVIRVTWRQLTNEPHAVVARLAAALALAAA